MKRTLLCPKCQRPLPARFGNHEGMPCYQCEAELDVWVFPAFFHEPEVKLAQTLDIEGDASCFHHPTKKAEIVCDACGRFLCALCDLEVHGRHICPTCLNSEQDKEGSLGAPLSKTITRHDKMCLQTSLVMLLFLPLAVVMTPIIWFWIARHWNHPDNPTGSGVHPRFVASFIISGLSLIIAVIFWVKVIN